MEYVIDTFGPVISAGVPHTKWSKKPLPKELRVFFTYRLFQHHRQQRITPIGVLELCARLKQQLLLRDLRQVLISRQPFAPLFLVQVGSVILRWNADLYSGRMQEEVTDGDPIPLLFRIVRQVL